MRNYKRIWGVWLLAALGLPGVAAAQDVLLKTNALAWAALSPNLGVEVRTGTHSTVDLTAVYRPWKPENLIEMRYWLVQPEYRHWFCEAFEGGFVGLHAHAAQYYGVLKNRIYDGYMAGAGVSVGYQWILSPHWNLEVEAGAGYSHLWYRRSPNLPCIKCRKNRNKGKVGPTRIGLRFCYVF